MTIDEDPTFVSAGALPPPDELQRLVDDAHAAFADERDGSVSDVYPALAAVDPDLFGIALIGVSGRAYPAGDVDHPFVVMSVSKPFVFALVCESLGVETARRRLGVNATGLPFNSLSAIEAGNGITNPMVNAGALMATALVDGAAHAERWATIREGLSRFAGRHLSLHEEVYASASRTNHRNRAMVDLLTAMGHLPLDPDEAVDLYTLQCSLAVTARDLAVMGATLADGGVNPLTGEAVVSADVCQRVLAVMATAGMYETSGDWLYDVGLPGKSGIGGGIVAVSPGKGALGVFSPRLDRAGNSVRGQHVARALSRRMGLDVFASRPFPGNGSRPVDVDGAEPSEE